MCENLTQFVGHKGRVLRFGLQRENSPGMDLKKLRLKYELNKKLILRAK
jgi:hypothetical protein